MVVLYHSTFYVKAPISIHPITQIDNLILFVFRRLSIGVPIFFVISGYCIAASCDSIRKKGIKIKTYFWRRFRRIFPPYWILCLISILLFAGFSWAGRAYLFNDAIAQIPLPGSLSGTQWLGNITLIESWRFHIIGSDPNLFLCTIWSLCYEEQFYAVCGIFLLIAPKKFFSAIIAVSVIVGIFILLTILKKGDLPFSGFFFDGHWLLFASGIAVYYQIAYASEKKILIIRLLLLGLFLAALILRYGNWDIECAVRLDRIPIINQYICGFPVALIIGMIHQWDNWLVNLAALRPLRYCGQMCYSLYLVHWPVAKLVTHSFWLAGIRGQWPTLLITIPASVGLAIFFSAIFHKTVEKRFLNT
jgi:peptidoglycan/LPS O-acetylase OafA/YrhL